LINYSGVLTRLDLSIAASIRHAVEADLLLLEWSEEMWRYRALFRNAFEDASQGRRIMLIADVNQFPVGRLNVQLIAGNIRYADGLSRGYLYSLSVMTPFQGQGLGTQLIRTAESELVARGFEWATIAVATENRRARQLYERQGYRVFREDDSHWTFDDPDGREHTVHEACYALEKRLVAFPHSNTIA
jgi:ribosomal protein S18 acetylase RimI-like enzyme